jgi:hypothetical protein
MTITITHLEQREHGWVANVNGRFFHTTGPSGTMSAWVCGDREALPVVRKALLAEVRKAEARAAAEAEVEA